MIPDKIYFGFDEETHLESYCLEKKGKCQTEYIRKDVLLEWLKECKENPVITDLQNGNIQEIIEKIESL